MGKSSEIKNIVLLLDNFNEESEMLYDSFKRAGFNGLTLVVDDDGFFPSDVVSIYEYFCGKFSINENVPGKPRYFNQINCPDYWEISANNSSGKIQNRAIEKARIFYSEPKYKRLVRVVDWLNDKGIVRVCDHYNKYGALYAKTFFNKLGQKFCKTYYDADGKEIITENFVTNSIVLNRDNRIYVYKNKVDLILKVIDELKSANCSIYFNSLSTPFFVSNRMPKDGEGDILFWQENVRNDIPGNMQMIFNDKTSRVKKVLVQKKDSYNKLIELGAPSDIVKPLGFAFDFKKNNNNSKEILICTNSDNIEKINEIVEALPNMHFNIAAITEMSPKLLSVGDYKNVSLFPAARIKMIEELFDKCDIYLDINHENEIVSAIKNAFLHNHLILGFEGIIHDKRFIAKEHIFNDHKLLIDFINKVDDNILDIERQIEIQRNHALSEDINKYVELL